MLYLKATHIVFVVTWFAGLFYLARLLIYHREAQDKSETEKDILSRQFILMSRRLLFIITWPSAVLTLILGSWLLSYYHDVPVWLWIKLGCVLLLFAYHFSLDRLVRQQGRGVFPMNSMHLRLYNEVPTVLLVAISFLAVVKNEVSAIYGISGLIVLVLLLLLGVRVNRALRKD